VDVKSFCDQAENDLIAWKAKIYDIIRKTENLDKLNKDKVAPLVNNLEELVDDLDKRIEQLAEECPLEWGDQKADIQERFSQVSSKWKDLDGAMDVWNMNLETPR
jgi:SMC interacting uncharacterized protein involved in chromosome segregation